MVDLRLITVSRAGVVHHRRAAEGVSVWVIGSSMHHTLLGIEKVNEILEISSPPCSNQTLSM